MAGMKRKVLSDGFAKLANSACVNMKKKIQDLEEKLLRCLQKTRQEVKHMKMLIFTMILKFHLIRSQEDGQRFMSWQGRV
jgi:hypothetical protein